MKQDPSSSKVRPKKAMKKTGGNILAETDLGDSLQNVQASTSEPSLPGTSKGKMKEESPSRAKNKGKSPPKQKSGDDNEVIKKAPSAFKPKILPVKRNYDYDDDLIEDGTFDGMASDDAAALCEYFI